MVNIKLKEIKFEYEIKELIKAYDINSDEEIYINIDESLNQDKIEISCLINIRDFSFKKSTITSTNISERKNAYKRLVYEGLSAYTKKTLPWGILTGIRPVKLVKQWENQDELTIRKNLYENYLISEEKISDMITISNIQKNIINKYIESDCISIYIGIPFCPSRCTYCSFYSNDIKKTQEKVKPYLDTLLKEIDLVMPYIKNKKISSLYFGGGTPSAISKEDIEFLLFEIDKRFNFENIPEVCFEAGRPDSLDYEKLETIYKNKISRISINPQTMNDKTLKLIGRNHNSEDIITCFNLARKIGFDNINMDIILGLEGESIDEIKYTMEKIKELNPDSLTIHSLSKKRASKLSEEKRDDVFKHFDNTTVKQMEISRKYAQELDMNPYYLYRQKNIQGNLENIGLSKFNKESIYNIAIMEELQTIIAFGAAGISKFVYPKENRIERAENVKNIDEYIKRYSEMANRKINEILGGK